jgi:hypothetical protein
VVTGGSHVDHPAGLRERGGAVTMIRSDGSGKPRLVLDLGRVDGGSIEVRVSKLSARSIHLGYSEGAAFAGPDGDSPGDPSYGNDDAPGSRTDDITHTGTWRSPGIRGGQRYISLQLKGRGRAVIDFVRLREKHLRPGIKGYAGHFLSSNKQLNRIWYAGAYTFALDSIKDRRPGYRDGHMMVVDGAKRDRMAWLGDLVVENQLGSYTFGAADAILKNSIAAFSCQQRTDGQLQVATDIAVVCPATPPPAGSPPPTGARDTSPLIKAVQLPEYTAQWIVAVHDYHLYHGHDGFARRMLPVIRRALDYFATHMDANGLFATPSGGIVLNWHPFDIAAGEDTHTNAMLYRALLDAGALEQQLGSPTDAQNDLARAAALKTAIVDHLWDPTAGAFLLNSNDPTRNHSQDAQVEAVLDGIVTGTHARQALDFTFDHLMTPYGIGNSEIADDPYMSNYVSPYISGTELLALLEHRQGQRARTLLRKTWGHMVDAGPGTLWEKVALTGVPAPYPGSEGGSTSLAHGWSGGSTAALSGYVLGIQPRTPGYRKWSVDPRPIGLKWAQGRAPTPTGAIVSRWVRGTHNSAFKLTVIGPRDSRGEVAVPLLGADRTIFRNGTIVWRDGHPIHRAVAHQTGNRVIFTQAGHTSTTYAWGAA